MNFLYWLYLWQNKEYRWDRLLLEMKTWSAAVLVRRWVLGLRRRPKPTLKLLLIVSLSLILLLAVFVFFVLSLGAWGFLVGLIFSFLLTPASVTASVGILSIPSKIITGILVFLAKRKIRNLKDLLVIGITGSYGKTSTKEAIAAVLSEKFRVLKTPGGVNTKIGIAKQILLELNQSHQIYVVEMGAYKQGEIAELVDFVHPKIGVLTGINEQHLGLFGNLENTKKAKFELIEGLSKDGVVLLNVADLNVRMGKSRVRVKLLEYESSFPEENINVAIKLAEYLELNPDEIKKGLEKFEMPTHRLEIKKGINGITILDDTYASNPTGFKAALQKLASLPVKRRILVTTGIYELGRESEQVNCRIADEAKEVCDDVVVADPINFPYFPQASLIEDSERLYAVITREPAVETAVLLEGRHRVINQLLVKLISTKPSPVKTSLPDGQAGRERLI